MKKFTLLLLVCLSGALMATAQNHTVTGTVTDDQSGIPLAGVTVKIIGTNTGTATDANGVYKLDATPGATLEFSYIGYTSRQIAVNGKTSVNTTLQLNSKSLSEVVVTGLGVATEKRKVPIDVSTVSSKDFAKSATASIGQALMGQVAGAQIQQTSGQPGSGVNIILRGINSLGGTSPMILVDGIEVTDLNGIDPATVDHVEVVKGAAAGMLYGAQGANGVIQIFTKKGQRNGKVTINLSSKVSIDNVLTGSRPLNAQKHHFFTNSQGQILDQNGDVLKHDALGYWPDPGEDLSTDAKNDKSYSGMTLYNHINQAFRQATTLDHSATISGGTENADYAFTVSRLDQQSVFGNKFNRTNLSLNLGVQLAKGLSFRNNTQAILGYEDLLGGNRFGLINTYPWIDFLWRDSLHHLVLKPKNENQLNSLSEAEWHQRYNKTNRLMENVDFNYKFPRFVELDYKYGIDFTNTDGSNYYLNQTSTLQSDLYWGPSRQGSITDSYGKDIYQNSLATFFLRTDFQNDFHLNVPIKTVTQVAYDYRKEDYRSYFAQGTQLPPFPPSNISLASSKTSGDYSEAFSTYGILFNQSVDIGNIAGISGGFRSDYSSEFGDAKKPFTFPRGTVYFRPSELMHSEFLPDWKLRAAYGEAGIQPSRYSRQVTLDVSTLGNGVALALPNIAHNPLLVVQRTKELEVGTDLTMTPSKGQWLNRISLSATYWNRKSGDIIQNADVAPSTGFGSKVDNLVSLHSSGADISLDANMVATHDFAWSLGIRFGKARSVVDKIANGKDVITGEFALKEGQEVGIMYGVTPLHSIGQLKPGGKTPYIDPSQASNYTVVNGMVVDTRSNQVQVTGSNDQSIIGRAYPKFTSSLINNFTLFKDLSLSFQFDWHYGNSIYNLTRQWLYRDRLSKDFDDPITIGSKSGAFVQFYNSLYNSVSPISWFVEDGSFVRLRNLSLTYDLTGHLLHNAKWIRQLSATIAGRNLLTFTKYKGMDPENTGAVDSQGNTVSGQGIALGVDDFGFPNLRSWQFGINIGF